MEEIKIFKELSPEAADIRKRVFVNEQGFDYDIEDIDNTATHFLAMAGDIAVGTCRAYELESGTYLLGRIAVLKEHRGEGIGGRLIRAAESEIAKMGGKSVVIHAQLHAKSFYELCGYTAFGELEYEQGKPHVWMKKEF